VHRHFAIRIIQAEYLMTRFASYTTGATGTQNDVRLSAGIVFRFGGNRHVAELTPVTYSCFVNPASVYPELQSPSQARLSIWTRQRPSPTHGLWMAER